MSIVENACKEPAAFSVQGLSSCGYIFVCQDKLNSFVRSCVSVGMFLYKFDENYASPADESFKNSRNPDGNFESTEAQFHNNG